MAAVEVQAKLASALQSNGKPYWNTLKEFIQGNISRCEFEEIIRQYVTTPHLIHLHNSLLMQMLYSASLLTLPTPPPSIPKSRAKRRRLLPYQGPSSPETSATRSGRLSRWAVSVGRKERDRIRGLGSQSPSSRVLRPGDEIVAEKGVRLFSEGKNASGTLLPLALCSLTRSLPTPQTLAERLYLISSQHDLAFQLPASRAVVSLLTLALEAHLKAIVTQALSLTVTSHSRNSSKSASNGFPHAFQSPPLTLSSFNTLFTLVPSLLPIPSAAVNRLAWAEQEDIEDVFLTQPVQGEGMKENNELLPVGELWGILKTRSGIRELVDQAGIRFT